MSEDNRHFVQQTAICKSRRNNTNIRLVLDIRNAVFR
jgi:hypothetical protein